jgi:hypothetical protein
MTPSLFMLAQNTPGRGIQHLFENLQSAMRPNQVGPPAVMLVLGFVGGIVALLLVLAIIRSRRETQENRSRSSRRPIRLFNKALKGLGIGLLDRILMRRIARKARLAQPAIMLFSPALLKRYATAWIDSISFPPLRSRVRTRVRIVARKAFD